MSDDCPVCGIVYGGKIIGLSIQAGAKIYACDICGPTMLVLGVEDHFSSYKTRPDFNLKMAALSHIMSSRESDFEKYFFIGEDFVRAEFLNLKLPSPSVQVMNFLRILGDYISNCGGRFVQNFSLCARVGAFSENQFRQLYEQMAGKRLIIFGEPFPRPNPRGGAEVSFPSFDLTLEGWETYEAQRKGKAAGKYGFLAMQFNDELLENIVSQLKPKILEGTGYELLDVRQVARAGVIDNIMRAQIRDCSFLVADLTHDNPGAYWEAGYAEGLGKPVIYICNEAKFSERKTHFDTNHCTTVMWEDNAQEKFHDQLIATIRRSLNLFA